MRVYSHVWFVCISCVYIRVSSVFSPCFTYVCNSLSFVQRCLDWTDDRSNSFVYAPNTTCDDVWLSWPAVQERAFTDGTVLVFDVFNSVGNLFLAFDIMIKVEYCRSAGIPVRIQHLQSEEFPMSVVVLASHWLYCIADGI